MLDRRDLLIGVGCFSATALSMTLRPRRYVSLLRGAPLDKIIPSTVGQWQSKDVSDLLDAKSEDGLMHKLYGQTVERVYQNTVTQNNIMMLFAHGDTQSNDLQLHRPEVCYPAFGYEIVTNELVSIPLCFGFSLPARLLMAHSLSRDESILYWSRLGDFLPTNGGEQRLDRLKTTMSGIIADGLLGRLSMATSDKNAAESQMREFVAQLIALVPASGLAALVGTPAANILLKART